MAREGRNIIYDFCEPCMQRRPFYRQFEGVYRCTCGEERFGDGSRGFVSGRQVKGELRKMAMEGDL